MVSRADLKQYFRQLVINLLTRMQTSKTDKYVYEFARFVLFMLAINVEGLPPDFFPNAVEEIQPGCVPLSSGFCCEGSRLTVS